MNPPKISIITVVYNQGDALRKTIKSIDSQSFKDIEYIVIDGASTDHTREVILHEKEKITKWISEKDSGLYDAMNKGLALSEGEYVLFLNAGDIFANDHVLENIFTKNKPADVYYGDTWIADSFGNLIGKRRLRPPKQLSWKSFRMGMLVCHQSIIVKRTITTEYDLRYRVTADFDWVLKSLKKAKTIVNVGFPISLFEAGGISSRNFKQGNWERFLIMKNHYGIVSTLFCHVAMSFRLLFSYLKLGRM